MHRPPGFNHTVNTRVEPCHTKATFGVSRVVDGPMKPLAICPQNRQGRRLFRPDWPMGTDGGISSAFSAKNMERRRTVDAETFSGKIGFVRERKGYVVLRPC